jgi:hypothetical protein
VLLVCWPSIQEDFAAGFPAVDVDVVSVVDENLLVAGASAGTHAISEIDGRESFEAQFPAVNPWVRGRQPALKSRYRPKRLDIVEV